MLRRILTCAAMAAGVLAVPVLPSQAAPSGGCPYPPHRPALTLAASGATIDGGQTTFAFGSFRQNSCGIRRAPIHVQTRPVVNGKAAGVWTTVDARSTDSSGLWAAVLAPRRNILVRAFFVHAGRSPTTYSRSVLGGVRDRRTVAAGRVTG